MSDAPPLHGYRGPLLANAMLRPRGLTVALTREAGSGGVPIAEAVGRLLGWQTLDQDVLDYLTSDETAQGELLADVPTDARAWAEARLATLLAERNLTPGTEPAELARFALTLAARGSIVLVSTVAGFLLPPETTVHVRVVAPLGYRIGHLAARNRLTDEEAAEEARDLDRRRSRVLAEVVGKDTADASEYDLVLNAERLGVDGCATLIAAAVRAKQAHLAEEESDDEVPSA